MVDGGSPLADRKHRLDPGLREAFFRTPEPIIPVAPNKTSLSVSRLPWRRRRRRWPHARG